MKEKKFKPKKNITIDNEIRFNRELTRGQKLFFAEIKSLIENSKEKKIMYKSREMASMFNVSHQSVLNWIKRLCILGFIEIGIEYVNYKQSYSIKLKS